MSKKTDTDTSFSEKFAELEAIVEQFDSGEMDLDESLKQFERGANLSKELKTYLKEAENKVEKIKAQFDIE